MEDLTLASVLPCPIRYVRVGLLEVCPHLRAAASTTTAPRRAARAACAAYAARAARAVRVARAAAHRILVERREHLLRQLPPPRKARVERDQGQPHRAIAQRRLGSRDEAVEGGEVVAPGLDVRAREERRRQRGGVSAEQALALVDNVLEDSRLIACVPAGEATEDRTWTLVL